MTRFEFPLRVYVVAGAFALMALICAVHRLGEAGSYQDPYPFRTQIARLAPVRPLIAGERAIGYISNLKQGEDRFEHLYFPTQFVLAPVMLVPPPEATEYEFVLGNFTRQEDYAAVGAPLGLEVVKEFPMGVVLYRRASSGAAQSASEKKEATP